MSGEHAHGPPGIICAHVLRWDRPILRVYALPDGTWDFMCGGEDHYSADDAKVICTKCAAQEFRVGTLLDELRSGRAAERENLETPWTHRPMTDEELGEEDEEK